MCGSSITPLRRHSAQHPRHAPCFGCATSLLRGVSHTLCLCRPPLLPRRYDAVPEPRRKQLYEEFSNMLEVRATAASVNAGS